MKHRISQTEGKEAQNLSRIPLQSDLFRSKISKKIESQTDQKIVKGRKGRGRGGEELREASENRRRGPLFICSFVKSSNEGTVDDGRAKCSWPTGQNEFVSIITLHPAVSHEPARGPVIQPSTGCSRRCSTDFLVNIKVVH